MSIGGLDLTDTVINLGFGGVGGLAIAFRVHKVFY
jgi:hypothetical protein